MARAQQIGWPRLRRQVSAHQAGAGRDQAVARGQHAFAHAQHSHRALLQCVDRGVRARLRVCVCACVCARARARVGSERGEGGSR
eukprot:scaffold31094_cov84-Isochrysis_galbana.AAC.1